MIKIIISLRWEFWAYKATLTPSLLSVCT